MAQKKVRSCSCEHCKSACSYKPGWFAPGEAEKVAKFLKISLKTLFKKYLMVDYWEGSPTTFLLSPAIKNYQGGMCPARPTGVCIFLKAGKCSIHPVKPKECRDCFACDEKSYEGLHERVAMLWKGKPQEQIPVLLGKEPKEDEYKFIDSLMW